MKTKPGFVSQLSRPVSLLSPDAAPKKAFPCHQQILKEAQQAAKRIPALQGLDERDDKKENAKKDSVSDEASK